MVYPSHDVTQEEHLFRLQEREERVEGSRNAATESSAISPLLLDLGDVWVQIGGVLFRLGPHLLGKLTSLGVGNEGLANTAGSVDEDLLGKSEASLLDIRVLYPEIVMLETYIIRQTKPSRGLPGQNMQLTHTRRVLSFKNA